MTGSDNVARAGRLALVSFLVALAPAAALAAPAAGAGRTADELSRSAGPPTRLWYRVTAEITLQRAGDFTYTSGTQHNETTATLALRSRTAVLLYRQCTPLPGGDPKLYAELHTLRTTATCAEVRASLRRAGFRSSEIRRLRLIDDVRFAANGEGIVDEFERKVDVPAHTIDYGEGRVVRCAAQTLDIVRTTGPERVEGRLGTTSAARDGVTAAIAFPRRLAHDVETGSEGGSCVAANGTVVNEPRLIRGFGSGYGVFGSHAQYGAVPAPAGVRFAIGRRFGRSFTVSAPQTLREPLSNGTWLTTGRTKLTFTICPRGGRDVASC